MRDNAGGRTAGMLSLVVCGLPICLPLALAFAMPDRTRSRIIASSNWLNNTRHL